MGDLIQIPDGAKKQAHVIAVAWKRILDFKIDETKVSEDLVKLKRWVNYRGRAVHGSNADRSVPSIIDWRKSSGDR